MYLHSLYMTSLNLPLKNLEDSLSSAIYVKKKQQTYCRFDVRQKHARDFSMLQDFATLPTFLSVELSSSVDQLFFPLTIVLLRQNYVLKGIHDIHNGRQLGKNGNYNIRARPVRPQQSKHGHLSNVYKHLESLPDTSSQIFNWKPCQTLLSSLTGIRLSPKQVTQVDQWPAYHQQNHGRLQKIIRRQSNSMQTYSLLTDVLPL